MTAQRINGVRRGEPITITVNGEEVEAYAGESIAAALLASGRRAIRQNVKGGTPRGYFCGMGMCFDCMATVDGNPNVRTCMTEVHSDCVVETSS